jgi:hypothetical protein
MHIPTSIPSIRRLSSNDVKTHKETHKEMVPDFNNLWWRVVKIKINLDPKINLERDDIVIAVGIVQRYQGNK